MALTFPLSPPRPEDIERIRIIAETRAGSFVSPFTGHRQVHIHQAQFWRMEVELAPLPRVSAAPWIAFLVGLNGLEGTFLLGDPNAGQAAGTAGTDPGAPVVVGASQSGSNLKIDGAPASVDNYMLAGDYIQLGTGASTRFHQVVQNASTTSGGNVTLTIWPNLRASPADNAAVKVNSAEGIWRLRSNIRLWDERPLIYGMEFSAIEDL